VTPGTIPDKRAMNRWSAAKLKANGYQERGLINVYDRTEISAFIAQKIAEGGHCVLKREDRSVYRRLYVKEALIKVVTSLVDDILKTKGETK